CKEPKASSPLPSVTIAQTPTKTKADDCRDWSTVDLEKLAPLTEGRHAALLDEVWRRVAEKHFDPTLGCKDWPALRQVYARKLAEAADDAQAYGHINALLDELGHSHVRLYPPVRAEDQKGPTSPALAVRWIEEQLVVVRSEAEGPQGKVHAGATLLAVSDFSAKRMIEQVRARTEAHTFALEIARAAAVRLSCERAGQTRKLKVTDPTKDHSLAIRVVPCLAPQGDRVTLGNLRDVPTRVEHAMIPGTTVGVLAFNVWMLPMVKKVQAAMTDLRGQGMQALVLDLRGNPGGVGAMAVPVARMLLSDDGSLGTMRFREFEQELNVERGEEQPFAGPVAVVVDEGTASTSEIFVVGLRDLGRVTVVGAQPSAGAALPSVIEQMKGGALLQYVVADYHSPKGTVVEGKGVTPDIVVVETRDDFAAGRDPVLDAAVAHVTEALTKAPPPAADTTTKTETSTGDDPPAPGVGTSAGAPSSSG
nr:hypothetical protein [Deltaproteobacteria bacterium]